ncbi:hypothetical protein J0X12_07715 [Sneathiella sp. CAU 1612]|uniref:Uncharacterized protein n=1 Tax=Sneathiella sedimenti TaxID=2816034 RepID=A0ABS3F4N8_9PROT|nr:hypothetical protein [Sneathiella sedimenti]MBO0333495.1 hypothetical protein [Sneathiella sedimenti]
MTQPTDYIYVPLHVDLYAELVRRSGRANVANYIENQIEGFLEATEGDPNIWSAEYIEKHTEQQDEEYLDKYGNPNRGFQWQKVFLPNGTRIRMTYRGTHYYAEVHHEKLLFNGDSVTPSEFARKVANNTSRNAWRDIYINFPGEGGWKFANDLRG